MTTLEEKGREGDLLCVWASFLLSFPSHYLREDPSITSKSFFTQVIRASDVGGGRGKLIAWEWFYYLFASLEFARKVFLRRRKVTATKNFVSLTWDTLRNLTNVLFSVSISNCQVRLKSQICIYTSSINKISKSTLLNWRQEWWVAF